MLSTARLVGKNVLVTGASSGIGAETAKLFAAAGANVVITARRSKELDEVRREAVELHKQHGSKQGGKVEAITMDMSRVEELDTLLERITPALRDLDVVVNNAGFVLGTEKVGNISPSDVDAMLGTNVRGLIHLSQLTTRHFLARPGGAVGHIIQLGSVAGRESYPGGSVYCATKAAVRAFTDSLRKELVGTRIKVSEVQPGLVETGFSVVRFRGDKSAADKVYKDTLPLTARDVAEEIIWVASRPDHVQIAELFVLPSCQASPTIVHRGKQA